MTEFVVFAMIGASHKLGLKNERSLSSFHDTVTNLSPAMLVSINTDETKVKTRKTVFTFTISGLAVEERSLVMVSTGMLAPH